MSHIGLYVCSDGAENGNCILDETSDFLPNLTANFTVWSRLSSVVVSRSNLTILSVSDLEPACQDPPMNLTGFRQAMRWLMDFQTAHIPASASMAGEFWSSGQQMSSEYWQGSIYSTFQSILVFPIWMFNSNNLGNIENAHFSPTSVNPHLPREFYTKATISDSFTRIIVDSVIFICFAVFQGILLGFLWGSLFWLAVPLLPDISSLPIMSLTREFIHTTS